MTAKSETECCDKPDLVKFLTEKHGDVWVCLNCKANTKPEVFEDEEIDALVEFTLALRKKNGN